MGTITQNLEKLVAAKSAIAAAIVAKGGTVNQGDGFEEFAADIATIPYDPPEPPVQLILVQFTEWDDSWTIDNFQTQTDAVYFNKENLPESINNEGGQMAWVVYNKHETDATKLAIAAYKSTGEFYCTTSGDIAYIKTQLGKGKYFCYFAFAD